MIKVVVVPAVATTELKVGVATCENANDHLLVNQRYLIFIRLSSHLH